jgi:hypothetical protein
MRSACTGPAVLLNLYAFAAGRMPVKQTPRPLAFTQEMT